MRLPRCWFPYYGWILMVVRPSTTILSYGTSQYLFGVLLVPVSERLSSPFLLGGCALVLAIGMSAFILAPSSAWLFVSVSIYGMVFGGVSPLYASVLADHVGRRAYGSIFAFQGIVVALCAGSGMIAAGWLYTHLHSYTIAFWGCVGLFLVAAPGIFLASPPQRARATQEFPAME